MPNGPPLQSSIGKRVGSAVYLHAAAIETAQVSASLRAVVGSATRIAGAPSGAWCVAKIDDAGARVSLLNYLDFFEAPFPALAEAWTVDLDTGHVQHRRWAAGSNRPILHRKELLIALDHPERTHFAELTKQAEALGLFDDAAIIGHEWQWEEELAARGLAVVGHRLVPRSTVDQPDVLRHRTALSRRGLSTPVQALWRHCFLDSAEFFDYGCGRGDDLAALRQAGVVARGWDPHFAPDEPRIESDVVNLGFVLNVIEDPVERRRALAGAWNLTRRVLAIGVLIGGRTAFERYRLVADGVLTSRNTFQKYFTTDELVTFVENVTSRQPVVVAPGLVFVFRGDEDEQSFLRDRLRQSVLSPPPRRERPAAPERQVRVPRVRVAKVDKWAQNADILDQFWADCLDLGRLPAEDESSAVPLVREALGTPNRVLARLLGERGEADFIAARKQQEEETLVYLSLQLFERRKSASALSERTLRDIQAFWGGQTRAQDEAKALLFGAGNADRICAACQLAAEQGLGHYEAGEGLHVVGERIARLPPVLRVYVGCAERLFGEAASADVCKIHDRTGKLSLLHYDNFWGKPLPLLVERVKIDLRRLRIEFFEYDGNPYEPRPLYLKSRWMVDDDPRYDEQRGFDQALARVPGLDLTGHGPGAGELDDGLKNAALQIRGWRLIRRGQGKVTAPRGDSAT